MASMKVFKFSAVFLFCLACVLGEICTKRAYNSFTGYYSTITTYCTYGCCGSYNDQYCCSRSYSPGASLIVGCVIVGIVFVCILVAVICCNRRKGYAGRVIYHSGGAAAPTAVIHSSTSQTVPVFPTAPPPYPMYPMGGSTHLTSTYHVPYRTGVRSF